LLSCHNHHNQQIFRLFIFRFDAKRHHEILIVFSRPLASVDVVCIATAGESSIQMASLYIKLLSKVKVLILVAVLLQAKVKAQQTWDHSVYLNENFLLQWTVKEPDILFEAQVRTHGYVGFGFSRDGSTIYGADLFIAWIDDGHPFFYVSTPRKLNVSATHLNFSTSSTIQFEWKLLQQQFRNLLQCKNPCLPLTHSLISHEIFHKLQSPLHNFPPSEFTRRLL
jgi:hypothetical protein